jgi:hypothetical protein
MKIFSTKVHGVLDYATVAVLPPLFRLLGAKEETARFADAGAVSVLTYSLLTRYELGAFKVLPVPAHFVLDALFGAAFVSAAVRQTNESRVVRTALAAQGLFALAASVLTETSPRSDG